MNTVSFKEVQTKKTMNSHKRLREKLKGFFFFFFFFFNCLIFAKHAIFATETSRQPVAKVTHQNTSSLKI